MVVIAVIVVAVIVVAMVVVAMVVIAVIVIAMIVIAMIVIAVGLGRRVGFADGRTSRILTAQRGNQKREKQSEQWEIYQMTHTEPLRVGK
ncbi:MAG: hypothetical protein ACR2N1_13595 [Rubripirellula sp.]